MTTISQANIAPLRALLQSRIRNKERELSDLRTLLEDVDAAQRLLEFIEEDPSLQRQLHLSVAKPEVQFSPNNPFRPYTNKAIIWEVLDLSADMWLSTAEVQRQATAFMGREVPPSSIATSLTDLTPKTVIRRSRKVALTARALKDLSGSSAEG